MAVLRLPTRTDSPRYSFSCELDSVTFNFAFEWNDRDAGWYMSIADVDGVQLLGCRRIVLNYPLIALHRNPRLPPGQLVAIDTSNTDTEPGLADLGGRVKLLYQTAVA